MARECAVLMRAQQVRRNPGENTMLSAAPSFVHVHPMMTPMPYGHEPSF
jgi:hypothetical protein